MRPAAGIDSSVARPSGAPSRTRDVRRQSGVKYCGVLGVIGRLPPEATKWVILLAAMLLFFACRAWIGMRERRGQRRD
jgi:hypothetical protein